MMFDGNTPIEELVEACDYSVIYEASAHQEEMDEVAELGRLAGEEIKRRDKELRDLKAALVPRRGVITIAPTCVKIVELRIGKVADIYASARHDGTPDSVAAALIEAQGEMT